LSKKILAFAIVIHIILPAVIASLPIIQQLGLSPFYQKYMLTLDRLHDTSFNKTLLWRGKSYTVIAGYIRKGEPGFNELLEVIAEKRGLQIIAPFVQEIGLAYGDLPLGTMISPTWFVYVEYDQRLGGRCDIVIYHPFAPEITYELRDLIDWIKETDARKMGYYTLLSLMIWASLQITWALYTVKRREGDLRFS